MSQLPPGLEQSDPLKPLIILDANYGETTFVHKDNSPHTRLKLVFHKNQLTNDNANKNTREGRVKVASSKGHRVNTNLSECPISAALLCDGGGGRGFMMQLHK